jgi:hypothetical protein
METASLSQVKSSWGMALTSHPPSNVQVKERVELYLLPLWAFMASSQVNFTFTTFYHANVLLM